MNFLAGALLFLIGINVSYSQTEPKSVIKKVFYEREVFEKIFFDYKGIGEYPIRLPDGKFAFIVPDTTFQKFYPNIISDLASGWGAERMMHTRTFIRGETGSVLVNNSFFRDESMRLLILIDSLKIDPRRAYLVFHTTSEFFHSDMDGRYVKVTAALRKKGEWKITDLKLEPFPWKGYMFPIDSLFDKP